MIEELKKIKFTTGHNFSYDLVEEFELISSKLDSDQQKSLKEDFSIFLDKGKYLVLNTFSGGILFLKVPERIEKIRIEARTNLHDIRASVVYSSEERKPENIKYKPESGKIESLEWNTGLIFPNFYRYQRIIQVALLIVIGKIIKRICEYGKDKFAYMKIENDFDIEILIDNQIESKLKVELDE